MNRDDDPLGGCKGIEHAFLIVLALFIVVVVVVVVLRSLGR